MPAEYVETVRGPLCIWRRMLVYVEMSWFAKVKSPVPL
jgi:hypothetical protein